jgi:hypothetical protein
MRHDGKTGEAEVKDWREAGLLKPSLSSPSLPLWKNVSPATKKKEKAVGTTALI